LLYPGGGKRKDFPNSLKPFLVIPGQVELPNALLCRIVAARLGPFPVSDMTIRRVAGRG
jgi:hypothetical protein